MYLNSKGEMKLKDIAKELGVLDTQIRKWKSTDKWDSELKGTLPKGKRNVTNKKGTQKEEPEQSEVTEGENSELTDKQRLFCIYYVKYWNATKAALKAGYSKETAYSIGHNLLKKVEVQNELNEMKRQIRECVGIETMSIVQKYIDIAFADITDFLIFGQEELPLMNAFGPVLDSEGNQVTRMVNTVKFRPWVNVDGTLISEISQGKDGAKLKLHDKMKALDWLANHMDLLDTATREKLDLEKQKVQIARENLEVNKAKVSGGPGEANKEGIQEFIKATSMKETDIKELFEDDIDEQEEENS